MSSVSDGRRLHVVADLRVDCDGRSAHLTGSGSELRLVSDHPAEMWDAISTAALPSSVGSVNGPRAIGRLADQLRAVGLRFVVVGPKGELVRLGEPSTSLLGRLTTGSRAVQFGAARAVAPTALALVKQVAATLAARLRIRRRR